MKKSNWLAIAIIPAIFIADKWENFVIEASHVETVVEVEVEKGPMQIGPAVGGYLYHGWVTQNDHHYLFETPWWDKTIGGNEWNKTFAYPDHTFAMVAYQVRNDSDDTMYHHDDFMLRCNNSEFAESDRGRDVMVMTGLMDEVLALKKGRDGIGLLVFEVPDRFRYCTDLSLTASKKVAEVENE